ncbi:MAG: hypothetical protein IJZ66_06580 [Oscillibacter sp.]|nr:hypothetical protein [Oscillibacter sp.]
MKKKFLSILTGAALALSLLPAAALAAETPEVYVGGVCILTGKGTSLGAKDMVLRAEAAAMLMRYMEK